MKVVKKKLTPAQEELLTKLLGMLGSDFPGERANAGAQATQLLQKAGLTWEEYRASKAQDVQGAQDVSHYQPADTPADTPPPANWHAIVLDCLKLCAQMNEWELHFLDKLVDHRRVSAQQWAIVQQIHVKVTRERPWRQSKRNWN